MAIDMERETIRALVREVIREEGYPSLDLLERMVRVEEALKNIVEIIDTRFEAVDRRFEAVDRRFEDLINYMNKRFDDVNSRFVMLTTLISIGFVALGTLMTIFHYIR